MALDSYGFANVKDFSDFVSRRLVGINRSLFLISPS
jgi:hypothetical protein